MLFNIHFFCFNDINSNCVYQLVICWIINNSNSHYSVKIMLEKLDHEQLGIVTLNDFLEEFYPRKNSDHTCHKFTVYHYNGLQRSCTNNEVTMA